jgi:hypothetical protein
MRRRPPSLRPRSVLPNSAPPLVAAAFERFVDVAPAACQTARDCMRIPTKPAMHSNVKPATFSDPKPAAIPI